MKNILFIILFIVGAQTLNAQIITTLAPLPEPVSNNAVASASVNGVSYIYSFGGIDATKIWSGVHKRCYRMNTQTQIWEQIDDLPTGPGRIGAAATTIKNKIYIIGGYDVAQDGTENTLPYVHIYDPETNTFLADGTPPTVTIDDQVQAVYRDSLIFVVSGWHTDRNVNNIQIYNPQENTWAQATSIPNNSNDRVFGGSGTIVGDTLYYLGGAADRTGFPPANRIRKLWINPTDPTDIIFNLKLDNRGRGYRMGSTTLSDRAIWIGGAQNTYNFDGIAYDNSGPVSATTSIKIIDPNLDGDLKSSSNVIPPTMDLRGLAKLNERSVIIIGGMAENQEVTDRVYQIDFDFPTSIKNTNKIEIKLFPNPAQHEIYFNFKQPINIQIHNTSGQLIKKYNKVIDTINVEDLSPGIYLINFSIKNNLIYTDKILIE